MFQDAAVKCEASEHFGMVNGMMSFASRASIDSAV
jgi:hypothetical protein